jgi:hypothetical protein
VGNVLSACVVSTSLANFRLDLKCLSEICTLAFFRIFATKEFLIRLTPLPMLQKRSALFASAFVPVKQCRIVLHLQVNPRGYEMTGRHALPVSIELS